MRRVILVTGAPCSGKSTYVGQHRGEHDLVLDQDDLGAATMNRALETVTAMRTGTAWVIRCCPGAPARAALAARLGAELVHLTEPRDVLMARARKRHGAARHVQAVKHWLDVEADGGPRARGTDPPITVRTSW